MTERGKAFSRPFRQSAIPGSGKQYLSNVRVEDVVGAAIYLSELEEAVGQIYNVVDGQRISLADAFNLSAAAFGEKAPSFHVPLCVAKLVAKKAQNKADKAGYIPELEYDAVCYLNDDYIVDNTKLISTGYRLLYPEFGSSVAELGRWYQEGKYK